MHTVLTTPAISEHRSCQLWCTNHESSGNVCFTDDVVLDFPNAGPWQLHQLSVGLAAEAAGSTVVQLGINGVGPEELSLADAKRFAETILEHVRQAEAALIPAPRAAADGAETTTVADMRAIFGEPVEGRDYDVMPAPNPEESFGGLGSTWSDPAVRRAVHETIAESEAGQ